MCGYLSNRLKHDKHHRPVPCPTCAPDNATLLQGWVDDETLQSYEADDIDALDDDDIRRDGIVEGHCLECNGPDDEDCGDGEEIREVD
jgi:hypothetical protein